jgi:hypothetical protein
MSHRLLRSYATFLVVLGWLHVVLFTLLGFAPWLGFVGQLVPAVSQWGPWALYASPAVGLLVGALCGLGYFVLSGVIEVFLDQRDLLDEILQTHRHILRLVETRQPSDGLSAKDPFDLTDIRGRDEPLL